MKCDLCELLSICDWFIQMLEDGFLVRDISRDHEPDWSMRMLNFVIKFSATRKSIETVRNQHSSSCAL